VASSELRVSVPESGSAVLKWRYEYSGALQGGENMRRDEDSARRLQESPGSGSPPSLRLYRWQPWAISLGHHQSPQDLDLDRCAAEGIEVVRRPTGGRAILHAEELTYCVVMYTGRRGVLSVYNDISQALVCGLKLFGVDVALHKAQPNFPEAYRHASSIPCFTSSARYEIEWRGKKLVGSAQRRYGDGERDVVLQHGSILCGPAHRRLTEYLNIGDPVLLSRVRREMEEKTVDLREITGSSVDTDHLAACITRGFEEEWGIQFNCEL
jgi:lipoyl(octanoyl) transferase